jgi:hypothetical protein
MKSVLLVAIGIASAVADLSSPLTSVHLPSLRAHLLEQGHPIPNIPYETRFNSTINMLIGWGT